MPSKYLRKGPNKLKKCSERRTNSCGPETDGCCGVIACRYCLELETYDGIERGIAEFAGTAWTGTVGGLEFVAYWEREVLPDILPPVTNNSIGMSFTRIEAGTFTMGSPVSEPGRDADETEITTGVEEFAIGTVEVTQSQYQLIRGTNPSHFSGTDKPVETVSYADAVAFCAALSALPAEIAAQRTYRLPTEAEWEKACRAETTTAYGFGDDPADLPTHGWFVDNSGAETHDVGIKTPNDFSIVDMHGNVWEWCENSRGDGTETDRVIRGGAWDSSSAECRSAERELIAATTTANNIGFRVVMVRQPIPQVGECEFVVTLDGEEVYRKSCYEGQSCRDSSDSAEASIGYETGTLRWEKYEARPLPTVVDPITGCRVHFCGTCHCTTRCLCVAINTAIVEGYGSTQYAGEICDITYSDCEGPNWSGTVGGIAIDLQLDADEYDGSCFVHGTIAGEQVSQSLSSDCSSINLTFTLEDGATVQITSKECACAEDEPGICMCNRGFGQSPTLSFASANAPGTIHTITLTYSNNIDDGLVCTPVMPCQGYIGRFDGILALPMGGSRTEGIDFRLVCSLDCSGYCLYWRYDSRFIEGWCRNVSPGSVDCTCPATIVYPAGNTSSVFDCTVDPWSYQIPEWLIEEDPTNCE